jgi:cellulose synthase/poly-beta-1,6-N-acetylglucosamine synthase-like glycosyltransferase
MIVNLLFVVLFAILFFWLLAFPVSAWIVVHILYPRRLRRTPGEPGFRVNLIVPCKGNNRYLEENLRAYASQDYPDCVITFVTNTREDEANPVIASVARGNLRVRALVCGLSEACAPKVHAQIVAVESDPQSVAFVFGDSDMRPRADWLKEMARPFIDPRVSVTTSHRWVIPDARGLAPSLYSILSGYYCMYLASPILPMLWGGGFGISRAAYDDMGIAELWSTTASDDLALSNRMMERHVRPFFVPRGTATSLETHHTMAALMRWYNRQSLTGKLHAFAAWLGGLFLETLVSLSLLGSVVLLVVEAATGTLEYHALAAVVVAGAVIACSLITKLTYPKRRDIPLWQWAFLPLVGHFVIAASFWCSAFMSTMTWGSFTFTVGRDGKVSRIDPEG